MREFIKTAQMWQRKAMLKRKADVEVNTIHFAGKTSVKVSAFLRDKKGELAHDDKGEPICKIALLYYYDEEQDCKDDFAAVGDFLTNHKAI